MPHQGSREFPFPASTVFAAVPGALSHVNGMSVKTTDPASGSIQASTSVSVRSWGERVDVQVTEAGPDRATVTVTVRLKAQLFGWGKQGKVINDVLDAVGSVLSGAPAS